MLHELLAPLLKWAYKMKKKISVPKLTVVVRVKRTASE